MISPISLSQQPHTIENMPISARAFLGDTTARGDRYTIDSGEFKGEAVAFLRLMPADWDDAERWQVVDLVNERHVQCFATMEGAFHRIVALAYEHAARRLEQRAQAAQREADQRRLARHA
jgi:hypothetical protein